MNYTKTVWKDLPDTTTPLNASNLNHIEDGIKALYEKTLYSTTEQVVGTWIDGKPIYRKVIEYTGEIEASTWTSISISSLGIYYVDNLVIKGGYLKYPENITESIYSYSNRVQFLNYNNNISFYFSTSPSKVTLIVEYTKTTD